MPSQSPTSWSGHFGGLLPCAVTFKLGTTFSLCGRRWSQQLTLTHPVISTMEQWKLSPHWWEQVRDLNTYVSIKTGHNFFSVLAIMLGFIKLNWTLIGELTLAIISLLDALMLFLMASTNSIYVAYVGYVVFRSLYQMLITVASFEIASNITQSSYGLVFGFNTFLALLFQTILTTVVADSVGLALPPRDQVLINLSSDCVIKMLS